MKSQNETKRVIFDCYLNTKGCTKANRTTYVITLAISVQKFNNFLLSAVSLLSSLYIFIRQYMRMAWKVKTIKNGNFSELEANYLNLSVYWVLLRFSRIAITNNP